MSKFGHRFHRPDEMRDRAIRIAHEAAGHAICGRTRMVEAPIPTHEVCVQWPAHLGACWAWEDE